MDIRLKEAEGRREPEAARDAPRSEARPRAVEQHAAARKALLTERAARGGRGPYSRKLRATRPAPRRGRGPSSSTRLRERRCSQSERREAAEGRTAGSCARRAPLRGQGPSSSTRLRERRCSQSERREAAEGRREQEAARDTPRSVAEGRRVARGCARGAAHRASGARRPRAVESGRLRATRLDPGDWPRHPPLRGRGPQSSTRLRERRY
jgi:hypothetical protein